jgi:hypothetical protein
MAKGRNKSTDRKGLWLPGIAFLLIAVGFIEYWWVWITVAITIAIIFSIQSKVRASVTRSLAEIDAMDGPQFEHYLVRFFRARAYKAEHTGRSGDFGADLLLEGKGGPRARSSARGRRSSSQALHPAAGGQTTFNASPPAAPAARNPSGSWCFALWRDLRSG